LLAKVSSKGQIVLPKAVREKLNVRAGSFVRFEQTADGFKVVKGDGLASLQGKFKQQAAKTGISVDAAIQAAREEVAHGRAKR